MTPVLNRAPQFSKQRPEYGNAKQHRHDSAPRSYSEPPSRVRSVAFAEAVFKRWLLAPFAGSSQVQAARPLSLRGVNDLVSHPCATLAFCYSQKSKARLL